MIINGLGFANIPVNFKLTFEPVEMDWKVTSVNGDTVGGRLRPDAYADIKPPGNPPWTVVLGTGNFSQRGEVTGINSPDAVISAVVPFPQPPNTVQITVNELQK